MNKSSEEGIHMKKNIQVGRILDLPDTDCSDFIMNARKKVVFGPQEGPDRYWDSYVMRFFELQAFAVVPPHKHPWPHYVLFTGGKGKILIGQTRYEIEAGYWAFIPGGAVHSFWNTELETTLQVICIVPPEGDINPLQYESDGCTGC